MSKFKGARANISAGVEGGKRRFVKKSKWEMPLRDSKPYWDKICADIESKVSMKVRNPSSSIPILYPVISRSTIRSCSTVAAAAACNGSPSSSDINLYDISKRHLATVIVNSPVSKAMIKGPTSSLLLDDPDDPVIATELPRENQQFPLNFPDRKDNLLFTLDTNNQRTKLTRMGKLVNRFVMNACTRVGPLSSQEKENVPSRNLGSIESDIRKSTEIDEKNTRANINLPEKESLVEKSDSPETVKKTIEHYEDSMDPGQCLGLRDISEEPSKNIDEKENDQVPVFFPKRPRAPSLSIASALPSFGKVVISIEDIDSTENDDGGSEKSAADLQKSKISVCTVDSDEKIQSEIPEIGVKKPSQDFLKVPEIRVAGSSSYPIRDRDTNRQESDNSEVRLAEETYESRLRAKSAVLRKKHGFWPKRSIVHVFRALRTMKDGLRSKARMESENNRFFASPLDIYSPSGRSSISSDDKMYLMEADGQGLGSPVSEKNCNISETDKPAYDSMHLTEKIGKDLSETSTNTSRRYMQKGVHHLSNRDHMSPETFENEEDTSSFYRDRIAEKQRGTKIATSNKLISLPGLRQIFPRAKADKCLACMYQSLWTNDLQPKRGKMSGRYLHSNQIDDNKIAMVDSGSLSPNLNLNFPTESSLKRFPRRSEFLTTDGSLMKPSINDPLTGSSLISSSKDREGPITRIPQDSETPGPETGSVPRPQISQSASPKNPVYQKNLPTSLSLVSEKSRSVSDQDDSDQGGTDAGATNNIGVGGASKCLASCHMPINLKPSLEPLKALRSKKSRSIRSRVASAEKSVDSANEDDDESDYDDNVITQTLTASQKKLDAIVDSTQIKDRDKQGPGKIRKENSIGRMTTDQSIETLSEGMKLNKIDIEKIAKGHHFVGDDLGLFSGLEIIELAAKYLESGKTFSEILKTLVYDYSKRFAELGNSMTGEKNAKLAINLQALLVDSKNYLIDKNNKDSSNISQLHFSSAQMDWCNPRKLKRVLPVKSYNLIAPILGMPQWYPDERKSRSLREVAKSSSRAENQPGKSTQKAFDLVVHPPLKSEQRKLSFAKSLKDNRPQRLNPYSLFLTKPRRKAVTWRPLTERDLEGYDPEATLKMRAAKITDKICEDFCQWLDSLSAGTNRPSEIDVQVLKDMFETDFTADVCRTMQMSLKEMPMIPTGVAISRNCPDAAELALTRKLLMRDAEAEIQPKRTIGFGTSLPGKLRFIPPGNRVKEKWLQCENVPRELENMEAVWKGIENLTSVRGFINWLRAHPEVEPPEALERVLTSRQISDRRKTEFNAFKHLELDRDQIQSLKVIDNPPVDG